MRLLPRTIRGENLQSAASDTDVARRSFDLWEHTKVAAVVQQAPLRRNWHGSKTQMPLWVERMSLKSGEDVTAAVLDLGGDIPLEIPSVHCDCIHESCLGKPCTSRAGPSSVLRPAGSKLLNHGITNRLSVGNPPLLRMVAGRALKSK